MDSFVVPGFVVEQQLGGSAAGPVYAAHEESTGRPVALQRLRLDASIDRERLRQQAASLARMGHPHLRPLLGLAETPDAVVLVLERADGGSLADIMAQRQLLTPGEVVTACAPIAQALEAVHRRGLVHGDVTPDNMLFAIDGRPMLAGLGVSTLVGAAPGNPWADPAFVAPEILAGYPPTAASDVYGLAAVAVTALVGTPEGVHQLVSLGVEFATARTLEQALEREPSMRPSATALVDALFALAAPEAVLLPHEWEEEQAAQAAQAAQGDLGGLGGLGAAGGYPGGTPGGLGWSEGGYPDPLTESTLPRVGVPHPGLPSAGMPPTGLPPAGVPAAGLPPAGYPSPGMPSGDVSSGFGNTSHGDMRASFGDLTGTGTHPATDLHSTGVHGYDREPVTGGRDLDREQVTGAHGLDHDQTTRVHSRDSERDDTPDRARERTTGELPLAESGSRGKRSRRADRSAATDRSPASESSDRASGRAERSRTATSPAGDRSPAKPRAKRSGGVKAWQVVLGSLLVVGLAGAGVVGVPRLLDKFESADTAGVADPAASMSVEQARQQATDICGAAPAPSQQPPDPADWKTVVADLYETRAQAFAEKDPELLCDVYTATSNGLVSDIQRLSTYEEAGVRVEGMTFVVESATLVGREGSRVFLEIADSIPAYKLIAKDGTTFSNVDGAAEATWRAELVPAPEGDAWRFG